MNNEFPPQSGRGTEIEAILSAYDSIIDCRCAYYVSTPMTTGRASTDRQCVDGKGRGVTDGLNRGQAGAIYCRQDYVDELVARLRRVSSAPVIDPRAIIGLPDWTQSDYRVLSGRVIERYVQTVVFVEGWQYSLGCSYEFLIARRSGARTLTQELEEVSIGEGTRLISEAVNELKVSGNGSSFLKAVARELERYVQQGVS